MAARDAEFAVAPLGGGELRRALIIVVLAAAHAASASPLPLELAWDAPATCPTADDVRAELERVVEVEPGRTPGTLRAHVVIAEKQGRFRLHIDTERDGEVGARTLVADDCHQALRAVTLVLAIAFGEGVALRSDPPPPPSPPAVPPAAPSPATGIVAVAPRVARSRLRAALAADVGVAEGELPSAGLETGLALELAGRAWRARARVAAMAPQSETLDDGVMTHFAKLAATLDGCGSVPLSRARLDACAGAGLAVVRASASGTAVDHHVLAPWPVVRGAVELALPFGPIELRAIAALDAAPTRPRFEISGVGDVHRVDLFALAFALGVAWRL